VAQLRVDGGAARNDLLLQIQANVLQRPVVRPTEIETTAFGAALTAGVSAGLWPDLQATSRFWQPAAQFDPNSDLEQAYTRWEAARDAAIALGS
jgi:glycerol kinase